MPLNGSAPVVPMLPVTAPRTTLALLLACLCAALPLGLAQAATAKHKRHATAHRRPTRRAHASAFTAGAPGGLVVGLNAGVAGMGPGIRHDLRAIEGTTGDRWLREELLWSRIEPAPGQFVFGHFDHFMLLAARQGMHVLALLDGTPAWAGPSGSSVPADPGAYAQYVAAVVARYGPHGRFWRAHPRLAGSAITAYELWNEPYYDNGDNGSYDPARYASLVKAAAIAGRAADPAAHFLLEAEMTGQQEGSRWVSWIAALYRAVPDLNRYFDAVAIHPYGNDLTGLSGIGDNQLRRTELIRRALVAHRAANKPLWITEVGWPTCAGGSVRCTSYVGQAASLDRLSIYLHTTWASYVKAAFIYHYEDDGTDLGDPENDYGLTTFEHQPKPALAIFRRLVLASS